MTPLPLRRVCGRTVCPPMDDGFAISLTAGYIAIVAILTVYHLFALQSWWQRCEQAASTAEVIARNTPTEDIQRLHAKAACEVARRGFPGFQLALVLAVLGFVTALTADVAGKIHEAGDLLTLSPVLALDSVVVFATLATVRAATRSIRDALAELALTAS